MNIQEMIIGGEITDLEELLIKANANYKDLHKRLDISKKRLTMIVKNPKECGDFKTALAFGKLIDVKPSVLINHLDFGAVNITIDEMNRLEFSEEMGLLATLSA